MAENARKRGRPPSIDSEAALQALTELFRAKGFAAVSLDDLSSSTGLSRPSLYRSFGDKLSMYMAAMDAFRAQVMEHAAPALMEPGDLAKALRNFYSEMLDIYFRDETIEAGCLVFGTAPSSVEIPEIKQRLSASIAQLDEVMRDRIALSFPNAPDDQKDWAASLAANTLISFSARAKSGASKQDLLKMGEQSAKSICAMLDQYG